MLQKIKNLAREIGVLSLGLTLSFVIFMGLSIAKGWTEPPASPPSGNVGAPINTGITGQSKIGGLILNTGGAATGLIVQEGQVGIGTITPAQKLEVAGTVKSTGLQMTTNAGIGKVLTSDASGTATWQTSSASTSGGLCSEISGTCAGAACSGGYCGGGMHNGCAILSCICPGTGAACTSSIQGCGAGNPSNSTYSCQ